MPVNRLFRVGMNCADQDLEVDYCDTDNVSRNCCCGGQRTASPDSAIIDSDMCVSADLFSRTSNWRSL